MFIAVVLPIAKNYTEFKCLSANEWLSRFQFICTMECCSATKRKGLLIDSSARGSQSSYAVGNKSAPSRSIILSDCI